MAGMPYHLEKGPLFATVEALYNDPVRLASFLERLWQGDAAALGTLGLIGSSMYPDPKLQDPFQTGPQRTLSMRRDWFGEDPSTGKQSKWGTPNWKDGHPTFTTGYWSHYYGDVRSIVAETMMRAGELALGVKRPKPPATVPEQGRPDPWPVEFFWKCGQPRFEGWVTWREGAADDVGQVTVIFATPATPDQVLLRPADEAEPALVDRTEKWQGMWVCSHSDHRQHVMITCWPTGRGNWTVPVDAVMYTEGVGPVGTWAPRFGSGGTPEHPSPFEPAPQF